MNAEGMWARARAIAQAGGLGEALRIGALDARPDVSAAEGLVLALLKQQVRVFFVVLGHGNTSIGEVLRAYSSTGAVQVIHCRNEVAMAHAATSYAMLSRRTPAVLTSIGPGALQAYAGSLAAALNNVGVYHVYGDETTHGEGPNMQGSPGGRQGDYGRLTEILGNSYVLHTPQALRAAMRRGNLAVHRSDGAGPFYLCFPINVQEQLIYTLNLDSLPERLSAPALAPADPASFEAAAAAVRRYGRIVMKVGRGARDAADAVRRLAERIGAAVVLSPNSTGVLRDDHPLNMHVGGSKGSISGNYAMENAELLIAVGTRAVCQSDCSGTGYPNVKEVINLNIRLDDGVHYNRTMLLQGDASAVIARWLDVLGPETQGDRKRTADWRTACAGKKQEWLALRDRRCTVEGIDDPVWGRRVLTQPAAVSTVAEFAKRVGAVKFFDAGDVQATGFQVVRDDAPEETITESGASYMGFAASALLGAAAIPADEAPRYMVSFTGDGSFMMNPQILIDAMVHRVRGMVVLFDNRRMGAISSLQAAQFGREFATNDNVAVDYVAMARSVAGVKAIHGGFTRKDLAQALDEAYAHDGLSLVHVPVYWGHDPEGHMGTYGRWNVGPWSQDVQQLYAEQAI